MATGRASSINELVAGNLDRLVENSIRWTAILDEFGRVIADVQIYNDFGKYLVTCAGPLRSPVLNSLRASGRDDVEIEDLTETMAVVAVEGPRALAVPLAIAGMDASGLSLLKFTRCNVQGTEVLLSRIGYSGEFGFQFFLRSDRAEQLVERILDVSPDAIRCGQKVQELLRLEARSFDLPHTTFRGETALEAGLHWMIDFRKPGFLGREAVMAEKARGLERRLVGFLLDKGVLVARGTEVLDEDVPVGYVAQCAWSPALSRTIGVAYIDTPYAWVGIELEVAEEGERGRLLTVSAPFLLTESTKLASG